MSVLRDLGRWVANLFRPRRWTAEWCEDPPDNPRPARVYLIGEKAQPWSAAMTCPCGCGELIQLSLLRRDSPSWSAAVSADGAVTLHPSVWRVRGCKSHFFVRGGRILWARPSLGELPGKT